MSEAPGVSSTDNEEAEKKKKSVLEDKSKDDLIQIIKKQLNLLQKAKGKSDELNRKCTILENEVENRIKHEDILQDQIKGFEKEIIELKQTTDHLLIEKENKVSELKGKFESYEKEKLALISHLHEKNEQIECLSMQLDTVKKTCQCLQEELMKYQKLCEELNVEIKNACDAKDTALESHKSQNLLYESKLKEHSALYDDMIEVKNKYSVCIEENVTLNSKLVQMDQLVNDLQTINNGLVSEKSEIYEQLEKIKQNSTTIHQNDTEISFLIADNQNLVLELNKLKDENYELKEKINSFATNIDNRSTVDDSKNFQNALNNAEFLKIQQELSDMQKILCDVESTNSSLKYEKEELKEEYQTVILKLEQITKSHEDTEKKLKLCAQEKFSLENEIKKLSSFFSEMGNCKSGFELALLHGAESESLAHHSFPNSANDQTDEVKSQTETENFSPKPSISEEENFPSFGLEYALLDGGSISGMYENTFYPESLVDAAGSKVEVSPSDQCTSSADETPDSTVSNDIVLLRERLEAYADSLKEVLEENESLKLKMEQYENEKSEKGNFVEAFTNTEADFIEILKEHFAEFTNYENMKQKNNNLNEKVSQLESNLVSIVEERDGFLNEISLLKANLDSSSEIQNLKDIKKHLEEKVCFLEKQSVETSEKLHKKCDELFNYNSDLQSLISYVIEIIGNDTILCSSDEELPCNMESLKILVEQLCAFYLTNCSVVKDFEENLMICNNQKHELEEKFGHSEELNKFLEEEVKALQDELENIKNESNYYNQNYNNFSDSKCLSGPSELYCIEEANESEEKGIFNECLQNQNVLVNISENNDSNVENVALLAKDVIKQTEIVKDEQYAETVKQDLKFEDVSVHSDLYLQEEFNNSDKTISYNESSVCSEIKISKGCTKDSLCESERLKLENCLRLKTAEVDSLLIELDKKNKDLLKSTNEVTELQEKLKVLFTKVDSNKLALQQISDLVKELKIEKCKLQSDVANLKTKPNETLHIFCENIYSALDKFSKISEISYQECNYFEKFSESLNSYFNNMSNNFTLWIATFEQSYGDILFTNKLQMFQETFKQNFASFSAVIPHCEKFHGYDSLINDIEKFDINKQKVFNMFFDIIIANEKTLVNLKEQLNDYKSSKFDDNVQQANNDKEENVAKNQLIETETKLKKLKQISLKLKKELEDSKKQIREHSTEKERILIELNAARKEVEKISNEQFQCMQNYQSLQIEYDNTQDEFELQKENMKKLQDDFSATLLELNELKEKILDKDSQLSNSKEMLDAATVCKEEAQKLCLELEGNLIVAESKNEEKLIKIRELESVIEGNLETIKGMTAEKNSLKDQLSQAQKDESKKTLMDLEMADYERSVSELNNKLSLKEVEIVDLKQKLNSEIEKCESLQEEIKSTETLKEMQEKRATNLKDALDKVKAELLAAKGKEADLLANVSSLQLQLEMIIQQEENYKLQLSESSVEIQHLREMLKTSSENNQRIVRSLELKIASLQQDKISAEREVEAIKQEFENYKIRVHSVLRQQKSGTSPVSPIDPDLKEKLETMVDKLKIQVKDLK